MAFTINTNISSLQAQEYLRVTGEFQAKTINRVTSGLRIVSAGDDAAGLAIANGFRSDQAVIGQGIRNANDGLATLQTIDGGVSNISKLLDRARTLASQSASGTFNGDRTVLNSEFSSVMAEIDRQSQAIGLNTGGTFAKTLSVFMGGGRGISSGDAITNSTVSVDLSTSAVDTKSLGLSTYKVSGNTSYDLGKSSSTSVAKILGQAANGTPNTATFTVSGAGFSDGNKITVAVDTTAVTDTNSLVTAINAEIAKQANLSGSKYSAFKAAGVTASIATDANGRQQLVFSSSKAAFQVAAGDQYANALMGNISDVAASGGPIGQMVVPEAVAAANYAAATQTGITFTFAGGAITGTNTTAVDIASTDTVAQAVTKINAAFTTDSVAGVLAVAQGGKIVFKSTGAMTQVNPNFTVTVAGDTLNTLGFGSSAVGSSYAMKANSGGVQQSVQAADSKPFTWTNITANTQTLTLGVTHPDGTLYNFDVALTSSNAANIDNAVTAINTALQGSGDASLKNIVAVKEQLTATGAQGIRFMSADGFTVKLGTIASTQGLKDASVSGSSQQGTQLYSGASTGGGTADVGTQASAQSAVTSIGEAIKALGVAQAAVGKGQNMFNYAVSLASTQLTNLAASESRIRDADLAAEAANLSKAQILSQAGIAAMAQANSAPQAVLSLLRG